MNARPSAATPWLLRLPASPGGRRVFLVPHAGCGANIFDPWPERSDGVELLPVELPGRLTRWGDPMPDTFQELAAALVAGLRPYLDAPYALFGHCWSGLAVYEAVVQLQRAGLPLPERVFVSGQVAPQDGPVGRMLDMGDAELAAELSETIRAAGKVPHPELIALYTRVLRTDVEVCRRYVVPEPVRLDRPVTVIGWADDTEVPPERTAGWERCADTVFEVLPGGHDRFVEAPPELLRLLTGAWPSGA